MNGEIPPKAYFCSKFLDDDCYRNFCCHYIYY